MAIHFPGGHAIFYGFSGRAIFFFVFDLMPHRKCANRNVLTCAYGLSSASKSRVSDCFKESCAKIPIDVVQFRNNLKG
jgi:hypothetical protein